MFSAFSVFANTPQTIKNCKSLEKFARSIMKARQSDIPMSKVYESIKSEDNPQLEQALQQMVVDVYSLPSFSSQQMKEKMINDYGNQAFLECIKP
jgi:hypothetical protein